MTEEIVFIDVIATCQTEGCPNAGHAIVTTVVEGSPVVFCGVCSQQITDIKWE